MFRALPCPSSGARDYKVDYQERNDQCGNQYYSRELLMMDIQPGHYSSLTTPNLQPTANQERNDQCGNQHYSRELLMMDMVVPETC